MIEAAFDVAGKLFGLTFEERTGLPLYHPDVRAFEVKDAAGAMWRCSSATISRAPRSAAAPG